MPTVAAYIREAMRRAGPVMGRIIPIDSLTTTTITSNAMKRGEPASRYTGRYLVRREATGAPADRVRICSNFVGSTGVFTHAGANYADTTATSEYLEIHEMDPMFIDELLNIVVGKIRKRVSVIMPTYSGDRYYLGDQDWITGPAGLKVLHRASPVLSRNRYMEEWMGVYGASVPDWWTLTGAGATAARSTTSNRRGQYTCALARSGTNATLSQEIGLLWGGTSDLSLQGKDVTAVMVVTASSASQVRVQVDDGVTVSSSSYHTGGGGTEELTVSKTLSTSATKCTIQASIEVNGTTPIDEMYLVYGELNDSIRNDSYGPGVEVGFTPSQSSVPLVLNIGNPGLGQQYIVQSRRPYPQFTASRITGGTADADTIDAPLVLVATGLCAEVFTALARTDRPDSKSLGQQAEKYQGEFEMMNAAHLQTETDPRGGIALRPMFGVPARRFG